MASTPRPPVYHRNALSDIFRLSVDDVIDAEFVGEEHLGGAADDADRFEIAGLGQIDQRIAHAAGRRINENGLAFVQRQCIIEDVIGDLIVGERSRGVEIDVIGQHERRPSRRRDILRIMPAAMRPLARGGVDALADPARRDAGSDFLDDSGKLGAWRRRQRRHPAIGAGADQTIGHADTDGVRLDQNLARLRLGHRHVEQLHHARRTRFLDLDEFHEFPLDTPRATTPSAPARPKSSSSRTTANRGSC